MKIKKYTKLTSCIFAINIFLFSHYCSSYADTRVIYKDNDTIIGEDFVESTDNETVKHIPSLIGEYAVVNKEIKDNTIVYSMELKKFDIDLNKPYVILRDSDSKILKVYNTELKYYTGDSLKKDQLDSAYELNHDISINGPTEIMLFKKNINNKSNVLSLVVNYTIDNKIVKTELINSEK